MRRRLLYPAVSVVCGAVAAVSVGVLPAVGQSSPPSNPLKIGATAQIVARGAAAKPTIVVVCPSTDFATVSFALTEKIGKKIASGSTTTEFTCSGQKQELTLPIAATSAPFAKGSAFAQASLLSCNDFDTCTQTTATKVIDLVS